MEQSSDTMYSELLLLKDTLGDEVWSAIENSKASPVVLKIFYDQYKDGINNKIQMQKIKEKQDNIFFEEFDATEYYDENTDELLELAKKLDYNCMKKNATFKKEEGKVECIVMGDDFARYVLKLIKDDKKKHEEEWIEKNKPKPKTTKSRKTRGKFEGEIRWVNTKETAEGKDNEFYFKGDEDAIMSKPTFTAKDGSYKNMKYKAIKSVRYLGGEESKEDDEFCNGICIWDRATGSKAIAKTGLSPALFRVRCGELKANGSIYCSKCEGKEENFFHSTYQLGAKAKGQEFNGKTYKDFIEEELEYAD